LNLKESKELTSLVTRQGMSFPCGLVSKVTQGHGKMTICEMVTSMIHCL